MKDWLQRLLVSVVEPPNVFEQLEERIVLDATIDQVQVNGDTVPLADPQANVAEDAASVVDVHSVAEGAGATYSLKVDGQDVAYYNDHNGNKADVSLTTDLGDFAATGKFGWTPNNLDVGTQSFEVTADDHSGDTDITTIQLTVYNVAPAFSSAAVETFVADSGAQTFNVQSSDEGLGAAYSLVNSPPSWLGINETTGVMSGNPTYEHTGEYSFAVRVNDGHGGIVDQDFVLTVNNTLDFLSASSNTVVEDQALLHDAGTDTEALGKPVTYSMVGAPAWVDIDSETGVITGNPDNRHVGVYSFTIHAHSAEEGDRDQSFTLTVQNADPLFLNQETTIHMTESSGEQTFDVQNDDEGFLPTGLHAYSILKYDGGSTIPDWLSIDSDTGIITGNPLNWDVAHHTVEVQFNDRQGGIEEQVFNLWVENIPNYFESSNAATWVEDASDQSFNVKTHEEGVLGANVTYAFDDHGTLTWDGWLQINATTGVLTSISGQPDNLKVGDHSFTIYSDEHYGAALVTQDFTLTVMNTPPVISSANTTAVVEDAAGSATFQVTLANAEPGSKYSLINNTTTIHGNYVTINEDTGEMTIPAGTNVDVDGFYVFNIKVDDQHGGVAMQFFTITVTNVAPTYTSLPTVIDGKPTITLSEDSSPATTFNFNTDDEADGPTVYSLATGARGVSINSSTGLLSVTADNADVGDRIITVRFDDGHGGVVDQDVRIRVSNVDLIITSDNHVTWLEDAGYQSFDIQSTDEAAGGTFYSLVGAPAWLSLDSAAGAIHVVPENAQVGVYTFNVVVNDTHGSIVTQPFTLTVTNVLPTFDTSAEVYFDVEGGSQSFDAHTTDENSDHDVAQGAPIGNQYELAGAPDHVTINSKTGIISWDGTGLAIGDYAMTVRFWDGTGWIAQALTIKITDLPPSGAGYTADFFSTDSTRFLEDEPSQQFNVQYYREGESGVTYELLAGYPDWLQVNSTTGVISVVDATPPDPTNDRVTYNPATGVHDPYVFTLRVNDSAKPGGHVDQSFTLYVDNVVPWFQTPALTAAFTEDAAPQPTYNVDNSDEGHGSETSYSLAADTSAAPSWLQIDNSGVISANRLLTNNDEMGTWNIKVVFNDGHGGVIEQPLTVTLSNVLNFTTANNAAWQEDSSAAFSFDVNTDDDSSTHGVSYSLSGEPTWLKINAATGVLYSDPSEFRPDNTYPGQYTFTIHGDDGHGGGDQTFTLTVPNRDPVFAETVFNIGEDNGADVINLQVDDEDQGSNHWYYTWSGAPQWMALNPFTGEITADPTNKHVGDYTFGVTAYDLNASKAYGYTDPTDPDGIHGFTTETITVHVLNRDPEYFSADNVTSEEDSPLVFNVQTDDESDGGTKYSLSLDAPSWVRLDEDTGLLTANPTNAQVGVHTFQIVCDDQHGGVVAQDFTLEVENKAPSFLNPPGAAYTMTLTEDTTGNYFNILTDDEGQHNVDYAGTQVLYSLVGAPTGVTIDSLTGLMTFDPTNTHVGSNTFGVRVNDGNGGIVDLAFTLNVTNTTPVFTTPNAVIWYEEDAHTNFPFNIGATDEPYHRLSGPDIAYSLVSAPNWLRIDPDTGVMDVQTTGDYRTQNSDGAPDNHMVGVSNFTIDFFDGTVHVQQAFSLTINNAATTISNVQDRSVASGNPINEDTLLHIEGDTVTAADEYSMYTEDYYTLEIKLSNQGSWIRVDNGDYNAQNNDWNGNNITFDVNTGDIQWTPNNADVPKQYDGGLLHHNFRITHYDGHGSWAADTFFVEIINHSPSLVVDPGVPTSYALIEDTSTLSVAGDLIQSNDEGVGLAYTVEVSLDSGANWTVVNDGDRISGPSGAIFHLTDTTGAITWTPNNADVTIDKSGDTVRPPYQFRITADDNNLVGPLSANKFEFTVTVTNTDTAITASPGDGTVTEDVGISYNVQASDEGHNWSGNGTYDIQTFYDLQVSYWDGAAWTTPQDYVAYNGSNGDRADVSFNTSTGQFNWAPNHLDTMTPKRLDAPVGQYQFTVTHHDDNESTDSETFTLTVANRPPDIDLGATPFVEDATGTPNVHSDDEDLNGKVPFPGYTGDPATTTYALEVSIDGGTTWNAVPDRDGGGSYQPHSEGGLIYFDNETGAIEWHPTNVDVSIGDSGQRIRPAYQFKVTADDHLATNNTSTETFSLEVTNTATDITTDIILKQFAQGGTLTVTDGEVIAIDEYHSSTDDYYTLEILRNNTGSWIRVDNGDYNTQNDAWNGANIEYANFAETGAFSWTPVNSDVPNVEVGGQYQHQFRITHYDGHGSSDVDAFFVKIDNVPPTLVVAGPTNYDRTEDVTTLSFTDAQIESSEEDYGVTYILKVSKDSQATWTTLHDGDQINGPGGGVLDFNDATGQLDWTPTNADVTEGNGRAPYAFRIQADDHTPEPTNLSPDFTFTVSVTNTATVIDDAPPAGPQSWTEDSLFTYDIHATDEQHDWTTGGGGIVTDYDLDVSFYYGGTWTTPVPYLTYNSSNGDRSDVTFNESTGVFSWQPNHLDAIVGPYIFTVTHYDDNGTSDATNFQLNVANRAPVITDPGGWSLTEDNSYTRNIYSDDEALAGKVLWAGGPSFTGVTYGLQVSSDGGSSWITVHTGDKISEPGGGTITFTESNGQIDWTPKNADVTESSARPAFVFKVTADDGIGSSEQDFNVTVTNVATAFTSTPTSGSHVTEDVGVSHNIQAIDESHDWVAGGATDIVTYYDLNVRYRIDATTWSSYQSWTAYNGGNGDRADVGFDIYSGQFDWVPNHLDTMVSEGGRYQFQVIHHDDNGSNVTAAFDLYADNRAPQYTPGSVPVTLSLIEDISGGFNAQSDDESLNGEQAYPGGPIFSGVTYDLEIFSGGGWNTVNNGDQINGPGGGLISFDAATGVFSWDTRNADVTEGNGRPAYQFRVSASDGVGTTYQPFDVTVTNANTLIDASPVDQTITEDVGLSYNIHAIDEAHDWVAGGATDIVTSYDLQVSYWNGTAFTAAVDYTAYNGANGDRGDVSFNTATGQFDWVPNNADTGIGQFKFTVAHHDDNGSTHSRDFTLTVANNPPTLNVPAWWLLHEDDVNPADYTLDHSNIRSDDEGLGLTYRLFINGTEYSTGDKPHGPTGGAIYFDSGTGEIRWPTTNADVTFNSLVAPGAPSAGAYTFTIEANDGNDITTRTFDVDVYNAATDVNDIPNQTIDEDVTTLHLGDGAVTAIDERIGAGTSYSLEIHRDSVAGFATVADYNTFVTAGGGAPITFNSSTGEIDWAPRNADVGQYTFQVTHYDGHGSSDVDRFDVEARNTVPVYTSAPDTSTLRPGAGFTYDPSTTDEGQHDWRGDDQVVYSLVTSPVGMTFDPATGKIEWVAAAPGSYEVKIQVDDGNGGIATQTFWLSVVAPPSGDPPTSLPIEQRPESFPPVTVPGDTSSYGEGEQGEGTSTSPSGVQGGLMGATPMTRMQGGLLPGNLSLPLPTGRPGWESVGGRPVGESIGQGITSGVPDLLPGVEGHDLKQPSLEIGGSTAPITPLEGYGGGVAHGQRLDFSAQELLLWQNLFQPQLGHGGSTAPITPLGGYGGGVAHGQRLDFSAEELLLWQNLFQPQLGQGGSEAPDTPLEGFASAVEEGRGLNLGFTPIRETRAFLLDDLRVSDILGL